MRSRDVVDDLVDELDRIEDILAALPDGAWLTGSGAPGWSVADVVLHLAQSEEAVAATIGGAGAAGPGDGTSVDAAMDQLVRAQRTTPAETFERWRRARRASVEAIRGADPDRPVQWVAAPLKPRTLATTRLAEHWAHALDITGPLGIDYPDTDRLRHIAWLGHGTLPYAFSLVGEPPHPVHCRLTAPDGGTVWELGPPDAESTVSGPAGAFCRVGARRLAGDESGLATTGPHARTALRVLRNYAA